MTNNHVEDIFSLIKLEYSQNNKIDIQWKTQESNQDSVLFYNIPELTGKNISLAKSRIEDTNFKFCIVGSESKLEIKGENIYYLKEGDYLELQDLVLDLIAPLPDGKVFIGVTGTNGKTTTVELIRQILVQSNKKVITFGTLGTILNKVNLENFNLTTPSYIYLRKQLHLNQDQYEFVAMELTSHALIQKRIRNIKFDCIAWTNFTQDHLDYHRTMDDYFNAKCESFNLLKHESSILIPSSQGELIKKLKGRKINLVQVKDEIKNPFFKVQYNKDNLALAIDSIKKWVNIEEIDFEKLNPPEGRFNVLGDKDRYFVIDFAHTPDAVSSITKEVKEAFRGLQIVTVFGCGGDRDRTKRPLMAKAAEENSDFVVLTSDNPRFEDPYAIIKDAENGFQTKNYKTIVDRKMAIKYAAENFKNSVIIVAGKGHENYIDIEGVKHPYSDLEVIKEIING